MAFADPGYLGDPRLPIDTKGEVLASWARVKYEAFGYSPTQRETIKARIRRSAHALGVELDVSKSVFRRILAEQEVDVPVVEPTDVAPAVEANDVPEQAVEGHTGCMVALYPGDGVASELAVDGGEPPAELHVTLAFLGEASGLDLERLNAVVAGVAEGAVPLTGQVSGIGIFTAGEAPVTYASVDVPGLPGFRQRLFDALVDASFPVATSHGYTPHMTLSYSDQRDLQVPNLSLSFDKVWVVAAGLRTAFDLRGDEQPYEENIGPAEPAFSIETDSAAGLLEAVRRFGFHREHMAKEVEYAKDQPEAYVKETEEINERKKTEGRKPHDFVPAEWTHPNGHPRCKVCCGEEPVGGHCNAGAPLAPTPEELEAMKPAAPAKPAAKPAAKKKTTAAGDEVSEPEVAVTQAFVTEIAGKTILTAPIETLRAESVGKNPFYLWMEGAFVGGEEPNRNGALWSTGDLQFGEHSVKNGPLNWLHEARHIVGTIADGRLVHPEQTVAAQDEAARVPHIRAAAALWRWIFPDEAEVVQFAAEVGKLYYSMECVSESMLCTGPNGCGESFEYTKAMRGQACQHLKEHSSVRQLVNPTFLGGAVIVPPVRPGWAHADVHLLKEAASLAPAAYEQAGRPDMTASIWEQLMAEVVAYARA